MRRRALLAAALVALAAAVPAAADPGHPYVGRCTSTTPNPPAYAWQGASTALRELIPSHSADAWLCATLFYPADLSAFDGPRPVVVSVPPTGGSEDSNALPARDLAGHGYVVLTVAALGQKDSEPAGAGACDTSPDGLQSGGCPTPGPPANFTPLSLNNGNLVDAEMSGVDWLLSPADPLRDRIDATQVGAMGFSAGSVAVSLAQELDPRLRAIVALDNLTAHRGGDEGQASCPQTGPTGAPIAARVPALGLASDTCPVDQYGADRKKVGWSAWRGAGVPSLELVFAGTLHFDFGGGAVVPPSEGVQREFEHYVRAWFDRWLTDDETATSRLLDPQVEGVATTSFLSTQYRSAAFLPGAGVDCGDLAACLRNGDLR